MHLTPPRPPSLPHTVFGMFDVQSNAHYSTTGDRNMVAIVSMHPCLRASMFTHLGLLWHRWTSTVNSEPAATRAFTFAPAHFAGTCCYARSTRPGEGHACVPTHDARVALPAAHQRVPVERQLGALVHAEMYSRSRLVISREQGLRYHAGFAVPVLMS